MRENADIQAVLAKRSVMALFCDGESHCSHRVRFALAEKGISVEVIYVEGSAYPAALAEINPYASLPVLVDRELVLFESKILMEYLDERFPHPPLMPVYPVAKAESRQYMHRIERDWCSRVDVICNLRSAAKTITRARQELRDELISIAPLFAGKPYFMSDEFSLVDCCLAPLLWRLPTLGVQLPTTKAMRPLMDYMNRVFTRPAFRDSLSESEQDMRKC